MTAARHGSTLTFGGITFTLEFYGNVRLRCGRCAEAFREEEAVPHAIAAHGAQLTSPPGLDAIREGFIGGSRA